MSTLPPTADWELLEDRFYRKTLLYASIFPDLDLSAYTLTGAPFSGALALYRNPASLSRLSSTPSKPTVDIYSSAGRLIRSIPADKLTITSVGWSDDEKLLIVCEDGTVRCYYDLQGDFQVFSLGHGAEELGVRDVRFWGGGLVALLNNNRLVAVSRYDEPRPRLLADAAALIAGGDIHAWTLIPPQHTLSRHVEVLLSTGSTIVVVDPSEAQDQVLQNGPFAQMAVSPNGKYVALYNSQGVLWVITADFQKKLSEYDAGTGGARAPAQLVWCGNDSVVVGWEEELLMVGPRGGCLRHYYDSRAWLVPDVDVVRVVTAEKCEMWQKVPDVCEDIFRIGATSPGSVLLDAVEKMERGSPKADEDVQLIRAEMAAAVDACTKAAGEEWAVGWQKMLLRAASLGKSVVEGYASDGFVEMTETLRVLNAVRYFEIGLPLTIEQYLRLTPEKLLHRLISRRHHLLALRIAQHLRLPTDAIYIHWACLKIRTSPLPEPLITQQIISKLSAHRTISFASIARTAYDEGRTHLATQLLNHEPQPSRQVPLLMSMSEHDLALDKSLESGDPDLVHLVLRELRARKPLHEFFRYLNTRPLAAALLEASADPELLKDFYYQDDRRAASALTIFRESLLPAPDTDKLKVAASLLSDQKPLAFEHGAINDYQRLLALQKQLAADHAEPEARWINLPLHATIARLFALDSHSPRADRVKREFRVPDTTFTWLRLRSLVAKRDWAAIEAVVDSGRNGGVRWERWVEECAAAGGRVPAKKAVERCGGDRRELWVRVGEWEAAAREAVRRGEAVWGREVLMPKVPVEMRGRVEAILVGNRK